MLLHLAVLGDSASPDSMTWAYRFLALSILANLVLGLFNLLPIPPLDGGRILAGLLPRSLALPYLRLERWGILLVLFAVFLLPRLVQGFDPVGWALRRVIANAFDLVLLLSGHAT
ncbi:site-2 protease family protein [Siccirubricoccus deserti]